MAFELLSFLAGVAAGALTGALAAVLHNLETTADLQEKLRRVTREVEKMRNALSSSTSHEDSAKSEIDGLYRDLNEIQEEIRRIYKKGKG
jgi:gas vesicle protein